MMPIDDPVAHYERVTAAWKHLLGEDFHYGWFSHEDEPLEAATFGLTRVMAEAAAIQRDMRVLDVGCGIGNPGCYLAEQFGACVTGITTSETGVAHARQRVTERGLAERVVIQVGDGMNNGLADGSFDRAWVMESSHLMPDKARLLAECARALKPGGRLVLCDIILHRDLPLGEVLKFAREFTHLRYAFGRAKMETLATYGRFAEGAGLRVAELRDISRETLPTFGHWKDRLDRNREEVRRLIGDDGLEHFEASCEILPRFWRDRTLGYGLVVADKPAA